MRRLTERQQEGLDFIRKFAIAEGRTPSFRKVLEEMGYSSTNSVSGLVEALRKKGFVERTRRTIVLTPKGLTARDAVRASLDRLSGTYSTAEVAAEAAAWIDLKDEDEDEGA